MCYRTDGRHPKLSIQCLNLHVVHQNHNPFLHRYIITNRAREVAYFAHIWMVAFPFFSSTPSFNTDDARVLTTRSSALSKLFTKGKSIRSCKSKNFLRGWVGWNGKWFVKASCDVAAYFYLRVSPNQQQSTVLCSADDRSRSSPQGFLLWAPSVSRQFWCKTTLLPARIYRDRNAVWISQTYHKRKLIVNKLFNSETHKLVFLIGL